MGGHVHSKSQVNIPVLNVKKGCLTKSQLANLKRIKTKEKASGANRDQFLELTRQKAKESIVPKYDAIQRNMEKQSIQKIIRFENKDKELCNHIAEVRNTQYETHREKVLQNEQRRRTAYENMQKRFSSEN